MTESITDSNYIQRFDESILCSLENKLERITTDLDTAQKSTENVAGVWEGKKRAV